MSDQSESVNFGAITEKQRTTWGTGDFNQIARQNVCMAEALCEAVDPHAGERVLDIACGSGTAALVAARRYAPTSRRFSGTITVPPTARPLSRTLTC